MTFSYFIAALKTLMFHVSAEDSHEISSLICIFKQGNNLQLFHTFLCNSQNYHLRGATDDLMQCCLKPKKATVHWGNSFDCCTERYEKVVLFTNSVQLKYQLSDAEVRMVRIRRKTFSINNGGYEV